ncbi:MAG TPA: cytochrome c biogenesis heme-transporting ATPase CcmA [Steroidobacteraceae bacterium]|nr:cytochrome c biogenesis heme-transporting ATPase CcmA [Steroidobacteraceae bacterium]
MVESTAAFSDSAALAVRDLHLWRGERHLLRGVSCDLRGGELLQIVGANGIGKTSLLRCIAGLLPMETGEVLWNGLSIFKTRDDFNRSLAYLAHLNALKADLTPIENLRASVQLRHEVTQDQLESALARLHVLQCAALPVRSLSAGQKRRVALARVVLLDAPLWILDEPITNLDREGIAIVEQCIAEHLNRGGMVLTAAHQLLLQGRSAARTMELH